MNKGILAKASFNIIKQVPLKIKSLPCQEHKFFG